MRTFIIALFLGGCSTGLPITADGIGCGDTVCQVGLEMCCSRDFGRTGTCLPVTAQTCHLPATKFFCDGAEDCQIGYDCCVVGGNGTCHPAGTCPAQLPSDAPYVMCHSDEECPAAQSSCSATLGSFMTCQ